MPGKLLVCSRFANKKIEAHAGLGLRLLRARETIKTDKLCKYSLRTPLRLHHLCHSETVKIIAQLDYQAVLANQARPIHFALQLQVPAMVNPRPKPAAFAIVLDHSGSMKGPPLQHAKDATKLAIRNLRKEDSFALAIFETSAQVIIPMQSAANKAAFLPLVDKIMDAGSTNLTGGWMLGRDELAKSPPEASRRLLLLSDGLLNMGIVEPPQVRQIVATGLEHSGIRTSCLGFGPNYNEDLMAELARATGGQFYAADSPEKLPAIFAAELEGLQKLVSQNVRVRIKRLDFCESYLALGNYPAVTLPDGRVEFAVGDLVSEEERILCFVLEVLPLPCVQGAPVASLEGEQLLEVEVAYDEIGESEIASHLFKQIIRVQATQNPAEVKLNGQVVSWVAMQRVGKVLDEVTARMDTGRFDEAIQALTRALEALKAYGPAEQVGPAMLQLQALLEKIQGGEWNLSERKSSRYRSSSYAKMSSHELWTLKQPAPEFKKKTLPPEPPLTPPTPPQPPSDQP